MYVCMFVYVGGLTMSFTWSVFRRAQGCVSTVSGLASLEVHPWSFLGDQAALGVQLHLLPM